MLVGEFGLVSFFSIYFADILFLSIVVETNMRAACSFHICLALIEWRGSLRGGCGGGHACGRRYFRGRTIEGRKYALLEKEVSDTYLYVYTLRNPKTEEELYRNPPFSILAVSKVDRDELRRVR